MNLPFSRSYWVEPGRVLAGCYPGDKNQGTADAKLSGLLEVGVSRVINLMEVNEVGHGGESFVHYEPRLDQLAHERSQHVEFRRFPIVDLSVPTVSGMIEILDFLDEALNRGEITYVHCWGGRGRTGTVVACHLRRRHGLSGAAALSLLQDLTKHNQQFAPTPEMPCQRNFVMDWKEGA